MAHARVASLFALASFSLAFAVALLAPSACSSGAFDVAPAADSGGGGDGTLDGTFDDVIVPFDGPTDTSTDGHPVCTSPPCECDAPKVRCGKACVDVQTDPKHCGSCLDSCGVIASGTSACVGGTCTASCNAGFHACAGACAPNDSPLTCGTSCTPCPTRANATTTCEAGACKFACHAGFADCNGVADDGCEADLSQPAHCGGCKTICADPTANCSSIPGGGFVCTHGCTPGLTLCSGSCVDTSTSIEHCGDCTTACASVSNGTPTCAASKCGFTCDPSYHACGTGCASNASPLTCGTSCAPCAPPANATSTCDGTACGFKCKAGFDDCDKDPTNGCEADLSQPTNCGACGDVCAAPAHGTATCTSGGCGFTCQVGFVKLGDVCAVYGGTFENSAPVCPACAAGNPLDPSCSSCPSGFSPVVLPIINDCNGSHPRGSLSVCEVNPGPLTGLPGDFSGTFERRRIDCSPVCVARNPFTGSCSCPLGATPITFDVFDRAPECSVTSGGGGGGGPGPSIDASPVTSDTPVTIAYCQGPDKPITFFGAYMVLDDGTCQVKNPLGGGCACPSGSKAGKMRVIADVAHVATGATLVQCTP